jgi:hypothetical protein
VITEIAFTESAYTYEYLVSDAGTIKKFILGRNPHRPSPANPATHRDAACRPLARAFQSRTYVRHDSRRSVREPRVFGAPPRLPVAVVNVNARRRHRFV